MKATGVGDKCNNYMYDVRSTMSSSSIRNSSVHHVKRRGTMNHYQDDVYGQGNRMPGYMTPSNQGMGGMTPSMPGYPSQQQSHGNYSHQGQQGQMMTGGHQGTYTGPDMYQQHSSPQQYTGHSYSGGGPYPQSHGQINNQGAGNFASNQAGNYNSGHPNTGHAHHMRYSGPNVKNPQEVANSILQMAVSSYSPNQTVQVPLSKHRSAPYHVPKSPHYNVTGRSCSPPNQQQMNTNRHFVYPNSSPHHPARTSPISPATMPIHSPVSHHSGQSIPSSSPRSIHSPTHGGNAGSGCGSVRSPISAPSPGDMRSPCTVQSPASMCSPAPINQQLHVSVASGQQQYSGHIQSPTHKMPHYSPKTNPISPPGSQVGSPYTSVSSLHSSPQQVEHYTSPSGRPNYISDTTQDVKDQSLQTSGNTSNPLQSLQKLCMLPEKQVVDPKSVVNDACIPSPNSCDNSKNLNSDVDLHNNGNNKIDSSKDKNSPDKCDDKKCDVLKDAEKSVNKEDETKTIPSEQVPDGKDHVIQKDEVKINNFKNGIKSEEGVLNNVIGHAKKECENRFKKHLLNGDITSDDKVIKCLDKIKSEKENMSNNVSCDKVDQSNKSTKIVSPKSALNKTNDFINKTDKNHIKENYLSLHSEIKAPNSPEENGKMRSNSSVQNISSEDEAKSKVKEMCRTQVRKTRSLRGVPARLANTVYCEYSDSEDSDYHVRKDIGSTYSRQERQNRFFNNSVSPNKTSNTFERKNKLSENHSDDEVSKEIKIDGKLGNKKLRSNIHKKEENVCDKKSSGNSADTDNSVNHSSKGNHDNPGNHGNSDDQSDDCIVLSDNSDCDQNSKSNSGSSKNNPSNASPSTKSLTSKSPATKQSPKYSKRKRRKSSPVKYSDVYYGEDYAIDSEEEMELEKKNKRSRKNKLTTRTDFEENLDADVVFEYEGVDVHQLSQHSDDDDDNDNKFCDENLKQTIEKTNPPQTQDKPHNTQSTAKTIVSKKKARSRTSAKSTPGKSKSKGKIKKLESSKSRKTSVADDSFKEMRFKRTMDFMKKSKGKRKGDVGDKTYSPFIRVVDKNKDGVSMCSIINQPDEESLTSDKKVKKQKTTSVSVSTVHMSRLPSEKSICVPSSSLTDEENWNCALCGRHSSYKFLGDLFGPYYVEGNLPSSKAETSLSVSDSKSKKRRSSDGTSSSKRSRRSSSESSKPSEVWVHEDCVSWSNGVLLIGPKIYGLNEATQIASTMLVKKKGAMMGCLHKGCSQKFHSYCAVETGCYLDEENFSLLCPKHKDKKLRSSDASTSNYRSSVHLFRGDSWLP
ncbi:hypothetical protein KUTeg_003350 [Tegillarca granosa]|uniref:PHD-type domain-containing protein n=1 Tax=Tegillarca granosa TaxID=220873 RepID=A0ABQ9FLX6_TEGGR|nr:hypothetical protein KUTeg_003350 [Tegillarca granosa]